jgi:hypothetical protein
MGVIPKIKSEGGDELPLARLRSNDHQRTMSSISSDKEGNETSSMMESAASAAASGFF